MKHLDYVKAHMIAEPKDLAEYLKSAFEDYLTQLKEKAKTGENGDKTSTGKSEEFSENFDRQLKKQLEKSMEETGCSSEEELMENTLADIDRLKQQMYGNDRQNDKK